jgi:hypothetical protein
MAGKTTNIVATDMASDNDDEGLLESPAVTIGSQVDLSAAH